jgi:hypothetical protein
MRDLLVVQVALDQIADRQISAGFVQQGLKGRPSSVNRRSSVLRLSFRRPQTWAMVGSVIENASSIVARTRPDRAEPLDWIMAWLRKPCVDGFRIARGRLVVWHLLRSGLVSGLSARR